MILSHKFRFIFVKGMKVAGTSIEMALSTICGPDDIVTPISPRDELQRIAAGGHCQNYSDDPRSEAQYLHSLGQARPEDVAEFTLKETKFFNHMPLSEILRRHNSSLEGYRIVCAERSPYRKVLSLLNMRMTYHLYNRGGELGRADPAAIRNRLDQAIANGGILSARNIDRYRKPDGTFAGQVIHYANLNEDFRTFLASVGVCEPVALPHAKKGMMADTVDVRDYMRPDQIGQINRIFEEEFRVFGYSML